MNYITQSLESGEIIVYNGRLHWTAIASNLITAAIFTIIALVLFVAGYTKQQSGLYILSLIALIFALVSYIAGRIVRTRTEFAVTTSRFIQKEGILNIKMTEIPLYKIETVNFYQTFFQRILGTGCIELVGSGGTSHKVHYIQNPMEVRKTIVSTINSSQKDINE